MPIAIDPTEAAVAVTQPLTCDALFVDRLGIDASGRDDAPPKVTATVTPYATGTPPTYAHQSAELTTANLYAAVANIPEMGTAIGAVFAAIGAWHRYRQARLADAATARADADAATAAEQAARAVADQAEADRNAAFAGRSGVDDPAWVSADAAWAKAVADRDAAVAAAATAAANVVIADAAVADPANPPLAA